MEQTLFTPDHHFTLSCTHYFPGGSRSCWVRLKNQDASELTNGTFSFINFPTFFYFNAFSLQRTHRYVRILAGACMQYCLCYDLDINFWASLCRNLMFTVWFPLHVVCHFTVTPWTGAWQPPRDVLSFETLHFELQRYFVVHFIFFWFCPAGAVY